MAQCALGCTRPSSAQWRKAQSGAEHLGPAIVLPYARDSPAEPPPPSALGCEPMGHRPLPPRTVAGSPPQTRPFCASWPQPRSSKPMRGNSTMSRSIQNSKVLGGSGSGSAPYTAALQVLDSDMPQYIHDNTEDEFTHVTFINAYLVAKGVDPVNLERLNTATQAHLAHSMPALPVSWRASKQFSWPRCSRDLLPSIRGGAVGPTTRFCPIPILVDSAAPGARREIHHHRSGHASGGRVGMSALRQVLSARSLPLQAYPGRCPA